MMPCRVCQNKVSISALPNRAKDLISIETDLFMATATMPATVFKQANNSGQRSRPQEDKKSCGLRSAANGGHLTGGSVGVRVAGIDVMARRFILDCLDKEVGNILI